jgi:iron-sulfur cluster assembly protein
MSCCSPQKKQPEDNHQSKSSSCCGSMEKKEVSNSSCCSAPAKEAKTSVSRQMTIQEILGMFPYKAQRLSQEITNAGLHCVGCHAAVWETLEAGMYTHGKTDEQINELVDRLNALLLEKMDTSTIQMSAEAATKFLEILAEEGKQGWGMRFSQQMAGCNGFEYVLDFSKMATPKDRVFLSHGIEIHVEEPLVSFLLGSEIGFKRGRMGESGFVVSNPNVGSSCGCGSSHNY